MFGHDHFIKNHQKRIIKWDWFRISHDSKNHFCTLRLFLSFLFILEKKDNFILLCNIWSRVIIFSSSYFAMKGRARSFSPNNFKIITISRISREKLLLLLLLALSIYQSLYSFKKKKIFHSWFFMSKPKNHNNKHSTQLREMKKTSCDFDSWKHVREKSWDGN